MTALPCREHSDPDSLWFAPKTDHESRCEAARLCSGCPAFDECLAWAIAMPYDGTTGLGPFEKPRFVIAGLTEDELERVRVGAAYPRKDLCVRGHWSARSPSNGNCLACQRIKSRDVYRRKSLAVTS